MVDENMEETQDVINTPMLSAIKWTTTIPLWSNLGTEPTETKKQAGWLTGENPPANYFNWFWTGVSKAITENRNNINQISSDLGNLNYYVRNDIANEHVLGDFKIYETGSLTGYHKDTSDSNVYAWQVHPNITSNNYTGTVLFEVFDKGNSSSFTSLSMTYGGAITWNGHTLWNSGNQGTGSGMDADMVDGVHSSSFVRSDYPNQSVQGDFTIFNSGILTSYHKDTVNNVPVCRIYPNVASSNYTGDVTLQIYEKGGTGNSYSLSMSYGGQMWWQGGMIWNSLNQGSGSTMNADMVDGRHAEDFLLGGNLMGTVPFLHHTSNVASVSLDYGGVIDYAAGPFISAVNGSIPFPVLCQTNYSYVDSSGLHLSWQYVVYRTDRQDYENVKPETGNMLIYIVYSQAMTEFAKENGHRPIDNYNITDEDREYTANFRNFELQFYKDNPELAEQDKIDIPVLEANLEKPLVQITRPEEIE